MANEYMDQWNVNGELWDIHDKDRGIPNGVATLDGDGRIPYSQLPESAMEFKGYWNANTNTPTLADGTGTKGDFYITDTAGTQDLGSGAQNFAIGDRVLYDGSVWKNIDRGVVHSVSEISPDDTGAVDLSKQTDIRKLLNKNLIPKLLGTRGVSNWKKDKDFSINSYTAVGLSYGNGIWVTGTNTNGGIWWSDDDGNTWHRGTGVIASNAYIRRTYYANGIWLAIGSSEMDHPYWSEDGKIWNQCTGDMVPPGYTEFLGYIGGIYLCGTQNEPCWSEDGKEWHLCTGSVPQLTYVSYENGLFTSNAYWSEDGKTWSQGTNAVTNQYCPVYAKGLWVVPTTTGSSWSEDGKTWTAGTGTSPFSTAYGQALIYAKGLWLLGTAGKGCFWSEDGKTWTQCTMPTAGTFCDPYTLKYNNETFVMGSTTSPYGLFWSKDGKTWTSVTNVSSVNTRFIEYKNGVWLCFRNNEILYSENAVIWQKTSFPAITMANRPVYGNGVWMGGTTYNEGIWHTTYDWLFE